MSFYLVAAIFFLINFRNALSGVDSDQKRLLNSLFKNYNPLERPSLNESQGLKVELGISIQQIVDVDEKKQTIVSSGWLDMSWSDYNLQWNPEDFGNITSLRVPSRKIWVPDVLLYNSADESFDPKYEVNAVINYNGEINYLPPGMFKSICQIDIYQFPFDEQFCHLKFGSWTYDELTVELTNKSDSAQLDSYIENGEWALEKCTSYSESIKYECCPTKYPFVMFTIHIRRRTLYYISNMVFPCVLISFMSVLGFTLPPDSGEKIGLEIITLLSIIMFSQFFMGIIPESSLSVPKIGDVNDYNLLNFILIINWFYLMLAIYFASVIVISSMSIIANVLVLILHHRNIRLQKPLPKWVEKWICEYLAKCLFMKRAKRDATNKKSKNIVCQEYPYNSVLLMDSPSVNKQIDSNGYLNYDYDNKVMKQNDENLVTNQNLKMILKEIQTITRKIKGDEEDEEKSLDWKFAAMVIDRLCLIIFSLATFISTAVILLTAKNFFKFR